MAELSLRDLSKSFGDTRVVSDVNLDVADGEFAVFVGPSGCGKSTLLRMIAGLETASSGAIRIGGRDVTGLDAAKRGIAMVFQTYALYPHMSVAANMGFPLEMAGMTPPAIAKRVREAARVLHLEPLLGRRPRELSGGQRQRVAIGRAIVREPDVFLFDEPLSNLDAELRVEMRLEIARLHRSLGNTMVYVTHDQTEAMTLADRIVVLNAGRVEQAGTPQALYEDPDNLFVAGFIGSPKVNVLPGVVGADGTVSAAGATLALSRLARALPPGERVSVCLRPEHLSPAPEGQLPFTVEVAEYLGGSTWLYGRTGDGAALTVAAGRRTFRPGERCPVAAEAGAMLLFDAAGLRIR